MTAIAPHISAFLTERLPLERGASVHTCASYSQAFLLLFAFASQRLRSAPSQLALEQIDAPLVLAFLEHIETERGNSATTRNVRLAAIKSFMRFVEHRVPATLAQIHRILAIPAKKTDSRLVAYLSQVEMQALLDAPNPTARDGIRDRAMLHLGCDAGLRVSELVDLRLDEVAFAEHPAIRVRGKGRRERSLPLLKQTTAALRAWLSVRGIAATPEVFLNARGAPMTRSGFTYVLRKHTIAAAARCPSLEGKTVSPHVLRHTCAMTVLHATRDLRRVSLWLGHSSMQTTEIYTRADASEKLAVLEGRVPPTLRKGRYLPPDRLIEMLHNRDQT